MELKNFGDHLGDQWLSESDPAALRAQLKTVFNQVSCGVMIIEAPSGKALYANDRVAEIWRKPVIPEKADSRYSTFKAFWLDGRPVQANEWQSARAIHQGESIRDEEMEILRGDGTRGFISVSADPVVGKAGHVEAAVITIHDITEVKRQAMASGLLDEATQFLFSDLNYEKTLANFAELAVLRLGGWVRVSLLRENGILDPIVTLHEDPSKTESLRQLRVFYPFDPAKPNVEYRVIDSGVSHWTKDLTERGKDLSSGSRDARHAELVQALKIYSTVTVPLKSKQATFGVIKFGSYDRFFDETDFRLADELGKRASLAIENAILYKNAQDAIATRDDFLSIASHELKTPLTTLRLHSQLRGRSLAQGMTDEFKLDKIKKMLDIDHRQIERLIRLVDDMLDVSRILTGNLSMQFARFDLGELTEEVVARLKPEFSARATPLELKVVGSIEVDGDRIRLEQMIENLLTNALKYGQKSLVSIQLRRGPTKAVLEIEDHGMGIAAAEHERIFKRFERAVSSNEVSGLGLGLHIAREIATGHAGTIQVKSELGRGSTFCVELPISGHLLHE